MLYVKYPLPTKHVFFNPTAPMGYSFRFSTDLEKIGKVWDVSLANGTNIEVVSDPIEITRPQYGIIAVVKVKADVATDYHTIIKEFWIPACYVVEMENNAVESSKLAN